MIAAVPTPPDDGSAAFEAERRRLTGLAYRMLGSWAEAEDVVQDAWSRWASIDRDAVASPPAYLTTIVTRLAITALGSARLRRESYIGPWLPEPVDTSADPTLGAETAEALDLAVLLLMERLTPSERAAFVLREAFGYGYPELAEVLETSAANARQLVSRARRGLDRKRRGAVDEATRARLLGAFVTAAQSGDLAALEAVLAADVVSISDGGGVVGAARVPVAGASNVARFLLGLLAKFGQGVEAVPVVANGVPAFLGLSAGGPVALWTLDVGPEGVRRVLIVRNPEKLARIALSQIAARSGHS